MSITCPAWCNSPHRDDWDVESHDGPVWPNIASVDGNGDDSVQIGTRYTSEAGIVVTLEAQSLILTPEQAQAVAMVDKLKPDPILTHVRVGSGGGGRRLEFSQVHRKLRGVVLSARSDTAPMQQAGPAIASW